MPVYTNFTQLRCICIYHNVICCVNCLADIHQIGLKVMPLDQGSIIPKWQQELQDHAERINNVLDIPIKLRETRMENKKTIEADSFGICV